MANTLSVFYKQQRVGLLKKEPDDTLVFSYTDEWLNSSQNFPLSPRMPLNAGWFNNKETRAFFDNLLPEGHAKDRLNKELRDVAKESFRYFERFGIDCAGALVIADRLLPEPMGPSVLKPIGVAELDKIIDANKPLMTEVQRKFHARFSLAGAQDKLAVTFKKNKLYVPVDGMASTHILKAPIARFGNGIDTVFNEVFCTRLAKRVGLKVPNVHVLQGKYPYFVIDRYDRVATSSAVERLHQIDFCQASGYQASEKYEVEGGPSLLENFNLIVELSQNPIKDSERYFDWIAFNVLIGNNDCHSKNIAFLFLNGRWELAPFYDLLSTAIYRGIISQFPIGLGKPGRKQFFWHRLRTYHLHGAEAELGIKKDLVRLRLKRMAERIEKQLDLELKSSQDEFGRRLVFEKIARLIERRVRYLKSQHKITA